MTDEEFAPNDEIVLFINQELARSSTELWQLVDISNVHSGLPFVAIDPEDMADCRRRMEAVLDEMRRIYAQASERHSALHPLGPPHPRLDRFQRYIAVCEALRDHYEEMETWQPREESPG